MTVLEYAVHGARRGWQMSKAFLFAGAFAAAVVAGLFGNVGSSLAHKAVAMSLFGLWAVVFGIKAHRRFSREDIRSSAAGRIDLELGLLLVVATHAAVQMVGGLNSQFYPVIFVLVAFLVVYTPYWVGFALVAVTIGMEWSFVLVSDSGPPLTNMLIHSIFIIFFALINLVFTRSEMNRMRRYAKLQIEQAKEEMASDARDFRLTSPASGQSSSLSQKEEAARLSHSMVSEVRAAMYSHLDLLKKTMKLHTCLLLWLDGRGEKLRILECVSESDAVKKSNIDRGEGVLGAVLQSKAPLRLKGLRPSFAGLSYYDAACGVTDFLGVPVGDGGSLRGVLCADRCDDRPFDDSDQESLKIAVESLLRVITNERIFSQLQKTKSEQGKLFAASNALSKVLSEKDVIDAAFEAARKIASFDIAAFSFAEAGGRQVVQKAVGCKPEDLEGASFSANSSLAVSALKNRHCLPYRGEFDPKQQIIFDRERQRVFLRMRSAMILPLISGDDPLGTLVLASADPSAFGEEVRTTLQVMANQLGTVLKNAQMVRQLEEMATTDGLTGLPNHRVFQEELERKLASANRFRKDLSVILCDVDKFKEVNDKYGHPIGDIVLKGLGETLRRNVVRDTDLPARYGGEEFVVVCEGTTTDGVLRLAEKIRKDFEGQRFNTDKGEIRVTLSTGVATFPAHARNKEELIERADVALYAAKNAGRNNVVVWKPGLSSRSTKY